MRTCLLTLPLLSGGLLMHNFAHPHFDERSSGCCAHYCVIYSLSDEKLLINITIYILFKYLFLCLIVLISNCFLFRSLLGIGCLLKVLPFLLCV